MLRSSADLGLLLEELLVVVVAVRLLEVLHVDVAANNAEPALLFLLAFLFPFLHDALANFHEFLGEDAALDL